MIRLALRIAAAVLTASVLTFCVSAPKKKPLMEAPYDAKKELSKAQIELATGADAKALARFKNLAAKHPQSDVADDATIQIARVYFKQGHFDAAYKTYMSLVESDVFSPNEGEALLGASKCLHKLGRLDESLALSARGLKIPGLSDSFKLEFYRQRYTVLATTGDRLDALRALAYIFDKDPKPEIRATSQARAAEIVTQYLNESDLEKVVGDAEFGFVRSQAAYRLGIYRLQKKDYDEARGLFAKAAEWGQGTPYQAKAESYMAQIDSRRRVDSDTVGAVLPLTGKYSSIAYKTLNGLRLGLGIVGSDRSSLRLAVVDSEGTPDGARKSVERLVLEDSVIAIVGSLLSKTATSVAAKTEELGVPSIALSQKAGLTEAGTYIFRNAVTSEMQVKELVRIAMDQMGLKRFALLYPNDYYGVEYANLFWDEVLARGGRVSAAQIYNPSETDFRGPVKRLVGTYYVDDRSAEYKNRVTEWFKKQKKVSARQQPPDDLLPPVTDFDAIFIPDSAKAVGQIAPMLAYQGVTNVRLLGTNVWNSSDFVRRGQKNVDRALFIDSSLTSDEKFKQSKFFTEYKKIFGEDPGVFEAQGYETGILLRRLISGGERSRVGLASALGSLREFQGVSGPMTMNTNRELVRPLTPFTIKDSQIMAWTPELDMEPMPEKEKPKAVRPGMAAPKKVLKK
jgi:ABC-type branched-subunit amino acid transport system substrate-binding protein